MGVLTLYEFAGKVARMRELQRKYFATKERSYTRRDHKLRFFQEWNAQFVTGGIISGALEGNRARDRRRPGADPAEC
jgi:hypothetical protein